MERLQKLWAAQKNATFAVCRKFYKLRTVEICQGLVDQRNSRHQDRKGLY